MKAFFHGLFSFPLLSRELLERSSRPRTYWLRVGYGLLIYGLFFFLLFKYARAASYEGAMTGSPVMWGMGKKLFASVVQLQLLAIFLLQPALMAGGITYEKERDSLSLLLLTRMSPGKILLEKFLAGLLPMATLLLMALPLGAVAMAYGGVSSAMIGMSAIVLIAAWLQVATFSIFCSARFHTSVGAFIATYVGGALVYLALPILSALINTARDLHYFVAFPQVASWRWALFPYHKLSQVLNNTPDFINGQFVQLSSAQMIGRTFERCAPVFGSALIFLLLARFAIVRHSGPSTKSRVFAFLTGWWKRRWKKGPIARDGLPGDQPVAWREASRGWLFAKEQKVYAFSVGSALLGTFGVLVLAQPGDGNIRGMAMLLAALIGISICARAANSIVSERVSQTLDILLTTLLPAREIIRQKAWPVMKFGFGGAAALTLFLALEPFDTSSFFHRGEISENALVRWIGLTCSLFAYVPLIVWISLWMGLHLRSRFKVILISFGFFALWFALPILALSTVSPRDSRESYRPFVIFLGPGGIFSVTLPRESRWSEYRNSWFYNESDYYASYGRPPVQLPPVWFQKISTTLAQPWAAIPCNLIFYSFVMLIIRWHCLRRADRMLRR